MTYGENSAAQLPSYLLPETMGSIPIDSPRYVEPEHIYVDEEGQAYLYANERLSPSTQKLRTQYGNVALMLAMISSGETGHIADFRYVYPPQSKIDEYRSAISQWDDSFGDAIPIVAALCQYPDETIPEPVGDERYFEAVWYLAAQVDEARTTTDAQQRRASRRERFTLWERAVLIPATYVHERFRIPY